MRNKDTQVVALAQNIAKIMHDAGNRADALDAHDMARTFYRRMSIPSRLELTERRQSKKQSRLTSA
jgi:hypothetical protein